jgi:hypothetical protein
MIVRSPDKKVSGELAAALRVGEQLRRRLADMPAQFGDRFYRNVHRTHFDGGDVSLRDSSGGRQSSLRQACGLPSSLQISAERLLQRGAGRLACGPGPLSLRCDRQRSSNGKPPICKVSGSSRWNLLHLFAIPAKPNCTVALDGKRVTWHGHGPLCSRIIHKPKFRFSLTS